MESRLYHFLLKTILFAVLQSATLVAVAEDKAKTDEQLKPVIDPNIERREFNEAAIDTENFEVGAFIGFLSIEDFGTNPVYGVRLAYHITEDLFIEGTYGLSEGGETSYERLSPTPPLLTDEQREYTYYNASIGFNLLPGEAFMGDNLAFNTALYIIAGGGNTEFGGDDHFTLNYGIGYRFIATDFLAVRFDFRDHFYNTDIAAKNGTVHNLEFTLGLSYFF